MRKIFLLLSCLPSIIGCPAAPAVVGVVAGTAGGITLGKVTTTVAAGVVILHFVEKAYKVDRARLLRDKAQLELDLTKNGVKKTEIIQLTPEQVEIIAKKGYYIMKMPNGSEQKVSVNLD